ncbi:unnamed protein product [Cyclocybe aegerita]|uniref:Uncharacterized protein n=1 Tax=Cyclocybe aegerita TaxID=1973307 RepID=A0A8S0VR40_CYCAE|nr:unnamed protein product [Cyclocybe aegerita]
MLFHKLLALLVLPLVYGQLANRTVPISDETAIRKSGSGWSSDAVPGGPGGQCGQWTRTIGDSATFTFIGTAVYVVGDITFNPASIHATLDGSELSLAPPGPAFCDEFVLTTDGLDNVPHTLVLTFQGPIAEAGGSPNSLVIQRIIYTVDEMPTTTSSSSPSSSGSSSSSTSSTIPTESTTTSSTTTGPTPSTVPSTSSTTTSPIAPTFPSTSITTMSPTTSTFPSTSSTTTSSTTSIFPSTSSTTATPTTSTFPSTSSTTTSPTASTFSSTSSTSVSPTASTFPSTISTTTSPTTSTFPITSSMIASPTVPTFPSTSSATTSPTASFPSTRSTTASTATSVFPLTSSMPTATLTTSTFPSTDSTTANSTTSATVGSSSPGNTQAIGGGDASSSSSPTSSAILTAATFHSTSSTTASPTSIALVAISSTANAGAIGGAVAGAVVGIVLLVVAFLKAHKLHYVISSLVFTAFGWYFFGKRQLYFHADKDVGPIQISLFLSNQENLHDSEKDDKEVILVWQVFDLGHSRRDFTASCPCTLRQTGETQLGFGTVEDIEENGITSIRSPESSRAPAAWNGEHFEDVGAIEEGALFVQNKAEESTSLVLGTYEETGPIPFRPFLQIKDVGTSYPANTNLYLHIFITNGYRGGQYAPDLISKFQADRLTPNKGIKVGDLYPVSQWQIRKVNRKIKLEYKGNIEKEDSNV